MGIATIRRRIYGSSPMEIVNLDGTDRRLLETLSKDARAPTAQLARKLGLSRTTVQSRIERLERTGVIAGYTVRLSEAHAAREIHAYVLMTVTPRHAPAVIAAIRRMSAVRLLQSVSGPFDLLARVAAPAVTEIDQTLDALGALEGVERTTSSLVLSTKLDR